MKKVVTSEELSRTAKRVAQSKRFKSLQQRKDYVMNCQSVHHYSVLTNWQAKRGYHISY